jgi:hypothetical protein
MLIDMNWMRNANVTQLSRKILSKNPSVESTQVIIGIVFHWDKTIDRYKLNCAYNYRPHYCDETFKIVSECCPTAETFGIRIMHASFGKINIIRNNFFCK